MIFFHVLKNDDILTSYLYHYQSLASAVEYQIEVTYIWLSGGAEKGFLIF